MENLEKRQLLACSFEELNIENEQQESPQSTESYDSSKPYFSIKVISPFVAFPLGVMRALPEVALTLIPTVIWYGLKSYGPKLHEMSQGHELGVAIGSTVASALFTWPITHEIIKTLSDRPEPKDEPAGCKPSSDDHWISDCRLKDLELLANFALPIAVTAGVHYLKKMSGIKVHSSLVETGMLGAVGFVTYAITNDIFKRLLPDAEHHDQSNICRSSQDSYLLNDCRIQDFKIVSGLALATLPALASYGFKHWGPAIPAIPPLVQAGILVGATFVTYPLAHETINTLADPESCQDMHFCKGYLEQTVSTYTYTLDSSVQWLQKNSQPSAAALPILDPVKIYENTHSAASVLFTALTGSAFFPDTKAKLSIPHLEFTNNTGTPEGTAPLAAA